MTNPQDLPLTKVKPKITEVVFSKKISDICYKTNTKIVNVTFISKILDYCDKILGFY